MWDKRARALSLQRCCTSSISISRSTFRNGIQFLARHLNEPKLMVLVAAVAHRNGSRFLHLYVVIIISFNFAIALIVVVIVFFPLLMRLFAAAVATTTTTRYRRRRPVINSNNLSTGCRANFNIYFLALNYFRLARDRFVATIFLLYCSRASSYQVLSESESAAETSTRSESFN